MREPAICETSRARGHGYVAIAADAMRCAAIRAVSIDMSPAYSKDDARHLPNAAVTFDKFHVIAHTFRALDLTRR